MSKFRLALVRQKYRPDGGAERFVSRALEALDSSHLQLNVITVLRRRPGGTSAAPEPA